MFFGHISVFLNLSGRRVSQGGIFLECFSTRRLGTWGVDLGPGRKDLDSIKRVVSTPAVYPGGKIQTLLSECYLLPPFTRGPVPGVERSVNKSSKM